MSATCSERRKAFSPGLPGLMRAYTSRAKYRGRWEQVFEMTADMCELSHEEKRKGVMVMI